MLETVITLWVLCGIVAVMVASNRGQRDFVALLSSIILGPVGIVLAVKRKKVKMLCPYCNESVDVVKNACALCGLKIEEIDRLGENALSMRCLRCGKNDVHDAYLEDGSWGKWCPNCKMSIKIMRSSG